MSFKKVLGKVIPIAASVATSGVLGGGVAKQIGSILKVGDKPSEADIEKALASASPEQYVALHKLEADTKRQAVEANLKMEELDVERERIHQQDRDSARDRQVALRDSTPTILAWVSIGGFLGLLAVLCFKAPPDGSQEVLYVAVGILGGLVSSIKDFFFGSSKDSQDKDNHIREALKK